MKLDNIDLLSSSSAKRPKKKQEWSAWLILLLPVYIGESAVILGGKGRWHWQKYQDILLIQAKSR